VPHERKNPPTYPGCAGFSESYRLPICNDIVDHDGLSVDWKFAALLNVTALIFRRFLYAQQSHTLTQKA
jgi:hypothetical protein